MIGLTDLLSAGDQLGILAGRMRRSAVRAVVDNYFSAVAAVAKYPPLYWPAIHGAEAVLDVPYCDSGLLANTLDIYRPKGAIGPLPIIVYIHGGGFRITGLSKRNYSLFGQMFAGRGYLVYNIDYRLAPDHPFPAAIRDVCAAYRWILDDAPSRGGDVTRIALAGESAGANLVTSLVLAQCLDRPEPWAQEASRVSSVPRVAMPSCGLFQVTDIGRFVRGNAMHPWLAEYMETIPTDYLMDAGAAPAEATMFADPILLLERRTPPKRPLPPFLVTCGNADPIVEESRRLEAALRVFNVPCRSRYYDKGSHAFQAFVWTRRARRWWQDTFDFLAKNGMAPASVPKGR